MRWPRGLSLAAEPSAFEAAALDARSRSGPEHHPRYLSAPDPSAPDPSGSDLPASMLHLQRIVTFSTGRTGAWDAHQRLRPVLRDLARHRLRVGRGLDLDAPADAAAVREHLGAALYELVRSDRPAPTNRRGAGIELAELVDHVARLEAL